MKIWFIADSHFSHANIVRGCTTWPDTKNTRDFATVQEHDEYLLDQLNKRVKPSDVLYHLGDFGFGFAAKEGLPELRRKIACRTVYLVKGNHDHVFDSNSKYREAYLPLFQDVRDMYYKSICGRKFVLCHFAMRTWPWQRHGSIHLYGHSHGNLPDDVNSYSLDVGVDTNLYGHDRYTPYEFDEIVHIMESHKKVNER